ncbi:hypothetical protein M1D80_09520 [Phyllobacteriaceae bacterium JZ32]
MGYILPLACPNSLRMPHLAGFKKRYRCFLFVNLLGKFVEEFSPLGFRCHSNLTRFIPCPFSKATHEKFAQALAERKKANRLKGWPPFPNSREWFLCNDPATSTLSSMFLFFSNRIGCLGSILVSVVVTLVILALLGVL